VRDPDGDPWGWVLIGFFAAAILLSAVLGVIFG
jgi:hypothetical protein